MSPGIWFWIIFVILGIFGGWFGWSSGNRYALGGGLVVYILIGLVGWGVFGPPIR